MYTNGFIVCTLQMRTNLKSISLYSPSLKYISAPVHCNNRFSTFSSLMYRKVMPKPLRPFIHLISARNILRLANKTGTLSKLIVLSFHRSMFASILLSSGVWKCLFFIYFSSVQSMKLIIISSLLYQINNSNC